MRSRLALLLLLALAVTAIAPSAASAGTAERKMLRAINSARAANGVARVKAYTPLARTSERYAGFMLRYDVWAHAASPARGTHMRYVGEILGMTTTSGPAARAVVAAWLASPVHRAILLDGMYRYVGIGARRGTMNGQTAWVWVVRFGAR